MEGEKKDSIKSQRHLKYKNYKQRRGEKKII